MSRNCCRFLEVTSQPYLMPGTAVYCPAGSKSLGRGLENEQHYKGRAPQERRHMPRKMPKLQFLKESLWHPICTSCMFTSDYYQVITVVQNKMCNHPDLKCCSHSLFLKSCIYQSSIYSAFKVTCTCWLIYLTHNFNQNTRCFPIPLLHKQQQQDGVESSAVAESHIWDWGFPQLNRETAVMHIPSLAAACQYSRVQNQSRRHDTYRM